MSTRDDRASMKSPNRYPEEPLPGEGHGWPHVSSDIGDGPHYERWKKRDLYQRAKEMGIAGRSQMTKAELIESLRSCLLPH